MEKVSSERVSRYRQGIGRLVEELKRLCLKAGYSDLLFRGTPIKVYRKCGKSTCRCVQGGDARHGPYKAIQIWEGGKQRQISLKQSEEKYFEMAQNYQYQKRNQQKAIEVQQEILKRVEQMMEVRCICNKK